mgnify:CR=1 FL=1
MSNAPVNALPRECALLALIQVSVLIIMSVVVAYARFAQQLLYANHLYIVVQLLVVLIA